MRTEGSVRHKLNQARFRHLKREMRRGLSRRPENCTHNAVLAGPNGPLRICSLGSVEEGFVTCDETCGGLERAAACPWFVAAQTEETIKAAVNEFFRTADLVAVAVRYPDLAALMWVLGDETSAPPSTDEPLWRVTPLRVLEEGSSGGGQSHRLELTPVVRAHVYGPGTLNSFPPYP